MVTFLANDIVYWHGKATAIELRYVHLHIMCHAK